MDAKVKFIANGNLSMPIKHRQVLKVGSQYYIDFNYSLMGGLHPPKRVRFDFIDMFGILYNYNDRDYQVIQGSISTEKIYFIEESREFQSFDGIQWNIVSVDAIMLHFYLI